MQGGTKNPKITHYSTDELRSCSEEEIIKELDLVSKYLVQLLDQANGRIRFNEETMGVPIEEKPIMFRNLQGHWLQGVYVKEEKMFFIGFYDSGEFLFHQDVSDWKYITDNKTLDKLAKEYHTSKFFKPNKN